MSLSVVDHEAISDEPFLKFDRPSEIFLATAPWVFAAFRVVVPNWVKEMFSPEFDMAQLRGGFTLKLRRGTFGRRGGFAALGQVSRQRRALDRTNCSIAGAGMAPA